MALGVKKITESVIEEGRALLTIGKFYDSEANNKKGTITVNDNHAIDPGGLFTFVSSEGGILRIKTDFNMQDRINADQTLSLLSVTTRVIDNQAVTTAKIADLNVTTAKIANLNVTTNKIANSAVTTEKIKDRNVTSEKIAINAILNEHLNAEDAPDSERSVANHNIRNDAITTEKIKDSAVTTSKIANNAVIFEKLGEDVQDRITALEKEVIRLDKEIIRLRSDMDNEFIKVRQEMSYMDQELREYTRTQIQEFQDKYNLDNAVSHNGRLSVGQKHNEGITDERDRSTELINLHCTGDIQGNRVNYMTYQDLAEAYMPGEHLEAGDIVALHEDGLVYKANALDRCIVGVISDEFANCLGATPEEIERGWKVAVGTIGKVHVNIKGPVKLGQQIHVLGAEIGIGSASWTAVNSIGKALETIDCGLNEINKVLVQIRPM